MICVCPILVVLLVSFVRAELDSLGYLPADSSSITYNETEAFRHCIRKCDGRPRTCYYKLVIQRYSVLGNACRNCAKGIHSDCLRPQCITANGWYRSFIAVNRQLPAPAIHVCRGDRIVADVENTMADASVTIHWYGLKQAGYQYYDGVPYVTQCPIMPGTIFRYNFVVKESGTFFYHSHTGVQRLDGVAGALIVRDINDSQSNLYDEDQPDHVMFIADWFNRPAQQYIPGFNHPKIIQIPDTYLINGKGMHWGNKINLPLAEFMVSHSVRYRFRLIGGTSSPCGVAIIFQGHKVLAISADGNLKFSPTLVDTVILNAGDRFDVILEANQKVGTYFIFADNVFKKHCGGLRQLAILKYRGSKSIIIEKPPPAPKSFGKKFNALKTKCDRKKSNQICISHLQGSSDAPSNCECYASMVIGFDLYYYYDKDLFASGRYQLYDELVQHARLRSIVNNISFKFPQSNMMTQFDEIPRSNLCDPQCQFRPETKPCHCTSYYHVPYKTLINMIIYDDGDPTFMRHSFHLHGFNFYVIEQGVFPSTELSVKKKVIKQLMVQMMDDKINLCTRPQRDTISVPSSGYVLIRFYTDNPGYWLLHSQFIFFSETGMASVLRVGKESDLPPIPANFPHCGDFLTINNN